MPDGCLLPLRLVVGLPGCVHLWSPLLQLGVPPAEFTPVCRLLACPCLWLGQVAGLLPILVVVPLLGSSFLQPVGASGVDLLDLPPGSHRNGLCLGVGERRLRFPTHGTWLRHLGLLLIYVLAFFTVPDGPAHPCFRLTWVGLVGCAVQEQGVLIYWGGRVYRRVH